METLWYIIISMMLSIYVVLDGFDFGVGMLHLWVARTDAERRQVLSSIGPYWNGNEVWLVASGGLLVFAFPRVYAAGFSGFYLPLIMVLWLLILRGISIEFRSKEDNPLWRTFWDSVFWFSSLLVSFVFGTALGNIIRGVPVDSTGYFSGALFTNFQPGTYPGVLDWYTVYVGLFAVLVLAGHGALYLIWKTDGVIRERLYSSVQLIWLFIIGFGAFVTFLTSIVRPELYCTLMARPWTWVLAIGIAASLFSIFWAVEAQKELIAFLSSSCFIVSLLAATAAGMYPNMLISTLDSAFNITAYNGAIGTKGLTIGFIWYTPAIVLVIIYFSRLFATFSEKMQLSLEDQGH